MQLAYIIGVRINNGDLVADVIKLFTKMKYYIKLSFMLKSCYVPWGCVFNVETIKFDHVNLALK